MNRGENHATSVAPREGYLRISPKSPVRSEYDILSNIAHPSWYGGAGLYSKPIPSEKRHYFNAGAPKEPGILQHLLTAYSLLGIFTIFMRRSRDLSSRLERQGN
jgi:hypothetical protein